MASWPAIAVAPYLATWANQGWPVIVRRRVLGDPPDKVAVVRPALHGHRAWARASRYYRPPAAGRANVFRRELADADMRPGSDRRALGASSL
jgi:hypothetical protein